MRLTLRMIVTALLLSASVMLVRSARAADSTPTAELPILKVIPEDALAVVIVAHADKAGEQIQKLAQEMQFPLPGSPLPTLKMRAGVQEGFDDHGSAALAIMPPDAAGGAPFLVGIVTVSDYKKFIAQLQPEDATADITKITVKSDSCLVGQKDGFAVFVPQDKRDLLKKIQDGARPVGPVLGTLSSWVADHEVSFVATPTGVKYGTAAARKALAQLKAILANSPDQTTKMAAGNFAVYDWFLDAAEKEINEAAVGIHVDNDGGLHLDTRMLYVPGGSWAAAGKGLENPPGTRLASLPSGPFMLAFDGAMPKSLSKSFLNLSIQSINNLSKARGGKELSEADGKLFEEQIEKTMAQLQSMSMVMGTPQPGGTIFGNMAAVQKVKNARQYIADYQQTIDGMADLVKRTGIDFPIPQKTMKVKIDDLDGLEVTMDMSAMIKQMPNPAAAQMLQSIFGPDGKFKVYLAVVDDTTVAVSYVTTDGVSRVNAACRHPQQASLAADPDITATAKLLPQGAQWVGYVSPKGLIDFVSTMVLAALPQGNAKPAIPAFPRTAPIGIGAEASAKGLDLNIVVPGAAIKGIGSYVKQLQQLAAPGAPPQIR